MKAQTDTYITGDENYTGTLAFHNVDTLLVVVPHDYDITDQEKTDIENYVFWDQYQKKPVYIYKKETEITINDEMGNIQYYGPFCDFQHAGMQNIPVKQVKGGFMFNGEQFTRPTDSFFYLNDEASRLYTCRNSKLIPHQYANLAAGYFTLYIFRGMDLYLSGYCSNITNEPRVNNIDQMRKSYFIPVATRHFNFELAHTIIGRKIGVQSNSFFCEGFAVYTGYLTDSSSYSADLDSARANIDLLTEEIIVGPDYRFYSIPLMYPVSGVFTRFVIEKTGIETFKEIYRQSTIEDAFQEKGYPLAELITEFRKIIRGESQ
jgi:hypothetical protein